MLASTAQLIVAIVAVIALFISVISLIWTVVQGRAHLKQLRYASVPAIMTIVHATNTVQESCAGIMVMNAGSGAAIIENIVIEYRHDGRIEIAQKVDDPGWSTKFCRTLAAKHIAQPIPGSYTTSFIQDGAVLAAEASFWVISQKIQHEQVAVNTAAGAFGEIGFDAFLRNLEVQVEYRSLFGVRYTTRLPYNADGNA